MGGRNLPAKFGFALLVFCVGCGNSGPAYHPAKGKLTKGGQPLGGVLVTFTPIGGGASSSGLTNDAGAFELLSASGKAGAVAGKHKVTLAAQAAGAAGGATTDWSKMAETRNAATAGGNAGKPPEEKKDDKVPVEYTDPSKTPLPDYEVKSGNNEFDIKIP